MDRIRRAEPSESQRLTELALRSKAYWGYDPAFLAACRDELTIEPRDIERNPFFVLEIDGQRWVGFYGLEEFSPSCMELAYLFIEPAAIARRYGRALLDHAKAEARSRGYATLQVQSDPNAAPFYARAGGRRIGERPSSSIPSRVLPLFAFGL